MVLLLVSTLVRFLYARLVCMVNSIELPFHPLLLELWLLSTYLLVMNLLLLVLFLFYEAHPLLRNNLLVPYLLIMQVATYILLLIIPLIVSRPSMPSIPLNMMPLFTTIWFDATILIMVSFLPKIFARVVFINTNIFGFVLPMPITKITLAFCLPVDIHNCTPTAPGLSPEEIFTGLKGCNRFAQFSSFRLYCFCPWSFLAARSQDSLLVTSF